MRSVMNIHTIVSVTLIWAMLLVAGAAAQSVSDHHCHGQKNHAGSTNYTRIGHVSNSAKSSYALVIQDYDTEIVPPLLRELKKHLCPITLSQNHCLMCFEKVIVQSALSRDRRDNKHAHTDHAASIWRAYNIQQNQHLHIHGSDRFPGWKIVHLSGQRPLKLLHRFRI